MLRLDVQYVYPTCVMLHQDDCQRIHVSEAWSSSVEPHDLS